MIRFARSAMAFVAICTLGGSAAQAQTASPAGSSSEGTFSADVFAAATFGHTSASAFGGEIGYRFTDALEVFVEGGHMGNVTTADAEARASVIATALNGTANVVQKANFGDVGVKYRVMRSGMWRPYVVVGVGVASVKTSTSLTSNRADVTFALGADLDSHVTKPLIVVGGGVQVPFMQRFFGDVSYRYGQILAKTGTIEDDKSIPTQRIQVGVGVRF